MPLAITALLWDVEPHKRPLSLASGLPSSSESSSSWWWVTAFGVSARRWGRWHSATAAWSTLSPFTSPFAGCDRTDTEYGTSSGANMSPGMSCSTVDSCGICWTYDYHVLNYNTQRPLSVLDHWIRPSLAKYGKHDLLSLLCLSFPFLEPHAAVRNLPLALCPHQANKFTKCADWIPWNTRTRMFFPVRVVFH